MSQKLYNLFNTRAKVLLSRIENKDKKEFVATFMEGITQEQEDAIDKSEKIYGSVQFKSKFTKNIIPAKDIVFYGDVDLTSEEDLEAIESFELLDPFEAFDPSNFMPSDFDYDIGTTTNTKHFSCYDPITWFKYHHCRLGKPAKVIVYKLHARRLVDFLDL